MTDPTYRLNLTIDRREIIAHLVTIGEIQGDFAAAIKAAVASKATGIDVTRAEIDVLQLQLTLLGMDRGRAQHWLFTLPAFERELDTLTRSKPVGNRATVEAVAVAKAKQGELF